jgi:hypothetical protein
MVAFLQFHFLGIPTDVQLAAAFEQAPLRVAPLSAFNMPIQVHLVFNLILFAEPSQDEVQDISSRVRSLWEAAANEDKTTLFKEGGFVVQASIVDLPATDKSMMN